MLPARALNEYDLFRIAEYIPNFRGVFMLNELPLRPKNVECGIVNLDKSCGPGTHWVAYYKNHNQAEYFDSYGDLRPPYEIIDYLGTNIKYNYNRYQKDNSVICGHLCLKFLFEKIIYK